MTRGKFVILTNEGAVASYEFNGDMYWTGHGEEVMKCLERVSNLDDLVRELKEFNKKNFQYEEYDEDDISEFTYRPDDSYSPEKGELNFNLSDYFDEWFSDYLYIKNLSDKDVKIILRKDGGEGILPKGESCSVNFGCEFDESNTMSGLRR